MNEYYYQYQNGNHRQSGLVLAADKHAAYQQIRDLLDENQPTAETKYWEFTRVDNLLGRF